MSVAFHFVLSYLLSDLTITTTTESLQCSVYIYKIHVHMSIVKKIFLLPHNVKKIKK